MTRSPSTRSEPVSVVVVVVRVRVAVLGGVLADEAGNRLTDYREQFGQQAAEKRRHGLRLIVARDSRMMSSFQSLSLRRK